MPVPTFAELCAAVEPGGVEVGVALDGAGHTIRLVDRRRARALDVPVRRGFDRDVAVVCCSLALGAGVPGFGGPGVALARAWPELAALGRQIRRRGSDPSVVGRHDEEHLRRFVAARRAGDAAAMRRWWGELVIDVYDRMDGIVAVTHRGRLDDDEHERAVQAALVRFSLRLIDTFQGTSMGELVNATKTLARGICIDVQRRSIREREHRRSLDAGWDGDREDRPSAVWEADEAWARHERAEQDAAADAFLAWALPQLLESRRRVVERTFHGSALPEICDELGLSPANAYQLRSRGLRDLAKLKEQYGS